MALLPERENIQIQKCLNVEYNKLDYLCFVNELIFNINSNGNKTNLAVNELLFIMNKIILDNIFKYVIYNNKNLLINLLSNRNFTKDVYINPFYTGQILELSEAIYEDKTEIENLLNKKISKYMDEIYLRNCDNLNMSIFDMFNFMENHLKYIPISYYKFELANTVKPILIYSEKGQLYV